MVLRVYFDTSKTDPVGITSVAGHIGDEAAWAAFEPEWQKALDYWELDRFHLADLADIMGHERATLCVRNFARVIGASQLRGLCAGIRDVDWDAMVASAGDETEAYRQRFPTRYHACLDMVLGRLSMELGLNLPDEDTLVILDMDHVPVDAAKAIYDQWAEKNPRFTGLAIVHAPRSKPLQAADLFAGVIRREWAKRGFESERSPEARTVTLDTRTVWNAGGKGSYGSMWSAEIARQIAEIRKNQVSPVMPSASASEEE
jgi:hypothetical protein